MAQNHQYRYPGVKPFSKEERGTFFGRNAEIDSLGQFILQNRLVVLFGRSGLGKSSLLNAGVIPHLEMESDYSILKIRLGAWHSEATSTDCISKVKDVLELGTETSYFDRIPIQDDSIWKHFKKYQSKNERTNDFILIFDQFEELFTYPEATVEKIHLELGELINSEIPQRYREYLEKNGEKLPIEDLKQLYEPLRIKIVFSIRADRVSELDRLSGKLPDILDKRYLINPLTRLQAEDAILNPAFLDQKENNFMSPRFDFSDSAIDMILDHLSQGGKASIEPFQLQVICQYAERLLLKNSLTKITPDDLGELDSIFRNHYDSQIAEIEKPEDQLLARQLIEEGLIFEAAKRRISLYEGIIYQKYKLSRDLLKRLVDSHFLRAEPDNRGGFIYELSHDTLIDPVLVAKKKRIDELNRIAQEEKLAAQNHALRIERERRRRARMVAIGSVSLLILSLVALFLAYSSTLEAKRAEAKAQAQTQVGRANLAFAEGRPNEEAVMHFDSAAVLFPDKSEALHAYLDAMKIPQVKPSNYLAYLQKGEALKVSLDSIHFLANQYFQDFWHQKKYGLAAQIAEWQSSLAIPIVDWDKRLDSTLEFGSFEAAIIFLNIGAKQEADSSQINEYAKALRDRMEGKPWPKARMALNSFFAQNPDKPIINQYPEMIPVPSGVFDMGAANRKFDIEPVHKVYLDSFEISKYEITAGQFVAFLNAKDVPVDSAATWLTLGPQIVFEEGHYQWINGEEGFPVNYVSWFGAVAYTEWLSEKLNHNYYLPTEAEWEYAAGWRPKNKRAYSYKYAGSDTLTKVAWANLNSGKVLHSVGLLAPNDLGLYDMSGNLWEWCYDFYNKDYYRFQISWNNPMGPEEGEFVSRKGGAYRNGGLIQISNREKYYADHQNGVIGFRIVRTSNPRKRDHGVSQ